MDAIKDAVVSEELDFIGIGPAVAESPELKEETIVEEKAKKAMGDQEADMINHLLFHKSIIREPHEQDINLDSYLKIMKELDMGIHVALDNPVDRAAAIAFQLVIDERFDPWNLDIAEFTKLYLQKLKQEEEVNFIIAGRLVMMAWNILKSQSEHVLTMADRNDEPEECYFEDWDVMPCYEEETKQTNFSQYILGSQESIITEAVRATDVRQVTLMSLIEAFDEAREEIALKERAKKFVTTVEDKPIDFNKKMHNESLQEDISTTWQRICMCDDMKVPITQVWDNNDTYDKVTVLVSTLFLAKMEKVKLSQRKMPYGDIMVENIEGNEPEIQEDAIMEVTKGFIPEETPEEIKATSAEDLAVV